MFSEKEVVPEERSESESESESEGSEDVERKNAKLEREIKELKEKSMIFLHL